MLTFGGGGGLTPAPGMAFTPDSKLLAVAARDYEKDEAVHSVKLFDVSSGKQCRATIPDAARARCSPRNTFCS